MMYIITKFDYMAYMTFIEIDNGYWYVDDWIDNIIFITTFKVGSVLYVHREV